MNKNEILFKNQKVFRGRGLKNQNHLQAKTEYAIRLRNEHVIHHNTANKSVLNDKLSMDHVNKKLDAIQTPGSTIYNKAANT